MEIGGPVPQDHCDAAWNQQHMVTKISTVEDEGDGRCDNKSKIKVCLWLTCELIILEMKADNDPAFSLSVYYKSVKKWKYVKKSKTKKKKGKGKSPPAGVELGPSTPYQLHHNSYC